MLRGSSQYTLRYHLTAMHREVVIREKHSRIIVFSLGFREAFSLLPFCLCGFIWSNTVELGGFRKEVCFFDEIQYPYEDFCESLIRSWQGRGLSDIPQLLQCMDRFFQDNLYSISTEPSFDRDLVFAFTTYCKKRMYLVDTSSYSISGGGWNRTSDLQVMSLTSYHCSTPRFEFGCKSTNIFRKRQYYEEKNSE